MPVTKLESSEARNTAALATSSGSPMRPIGMVVSILAMVSGGCRSTRGVLIGPGLRTFERIRRSFSSLGQARTRMRTAALVPPEGPQEGVPLTLAAGAAGDIDPPSFYEGRAFCIGDSVA